MSNPVRTEILELHMGAERGHNHRPAIAVVSRIVDVLHARSHVNAAPHVDRVVGLHDVLATVVQLAIAEQKTEAAIGEIDLVIFAIALVTKAMPARSCFRCHQAPSAPSPRSKV